MEELSYRWTPLLHKMMWQAPSLLQSSEATDSSPTPEALQAMLAQLAVRFDLMKDTISRYSSSNELMGRISWK